MRISRMKTETFFLIACSMAMILLTIGCSKNNPLNPLGCGNGTWALQVSDEALAWSQAASNYNNDPTPENCTNSKNAAKSYLDALEGVRGCVAGVSQAEFNEALDEAKRDVDKSDCD